MTDDDVKALESQGWVVLDRIHEEGSLNNYAVLPGTLIIRRPTPEPEPSECERLYRNVLLVANKYLPAPFDVADEVSDFRAALARDRAAEYDKGYDTGFTKGYAEGHEDQMRMRVQDAMERKP